MQIRIVRLLRFLPVVLLLLPLSATAADSLPIGQLLTQDYWIVVHAAADGPRYTIKTLDGIVVQEGLTGELLADLYPGVHETLSRGIATPPVPESKIPHEKEKADILD